MFFKIFSYSLIIAVLMFFGYGILHEDSVPGRILFPLRDGPTFQTGIPSRYAIAIENDGVYMHLLFYGHHSLARKEISRDADGTYRIKLFHHEININQVSQYQRAPRLITDLSIKHLAPGINKIMFDGKNRSVLLVEFQWPQDQNTYYFDPRSLKEYEERFLPDQRTLPEQYVSREQYYFYKYVQHRTGPEYPD